MILYVYGASNSEVNHDVCFFWKSTSLGVSGRCRGAVGGQEEARRCEKTRLKWERYVEITWKIMEISWNISWCLESEAYSMIEMIIFAKRDETHHCK